MPKLTIDDKPVEVPAGATILDAAEKLGIEIPSLCFLQGYEPSTSCLVCVVKNRQTRQYVPACATRVVEGMQIDNATEEVSSMRRTALELLLSDHVGDCLAPCFFACPAHMDIPLMLRQIGHAKRARGDRHDQAGYCLAGGSGTRLSQAVRERLSSQGSG